MSSTLNNNTESLNEILTKINNLPSAEAGLDTSDATATAATILSGETAYVDGKKITGTIPSVPGSTIIPSTSEQTAISAGQYASGNITVDAIPSQYVNTSDATATASKIVSGYTAYVNGNKISGSITSRSSSSVTTSGRTVTIPAGYYASQVTKSVGTAKSATTYTPGTSDQTISSGYYLTGTQTIKGDSDLIASNIKSGVTIFNVTGTYTGATVTGNTCTVNINNNNMYTCYIPVIKNGKYSVETIFGSSTSVSNVPSDSVLCFVNGYGGGSVSTSGNTSTVAQGGGTGDSYAILKVNSSATGTITITL